MTVPLHGLRYNGRERRSLPNRRKQVDPEVIVANLLTISRAVVGIGVSLPIKEIATMEHFRSRATLR